MGYTRSGQRFSLTSHEAPALWKTSLTSIGHFVVALWLFTVNDFKTMIFPSIAFAMFYCLGSPSLSYQMPITALLQRLPHLFCWTWINLLAFTVNNQRHLEAITEDCLNKPWRPIPAGRISIEGARILGILAYIAAILTSLALNGGLVHSLLLLSLGYVYNNRPDTTNQGCLTRNLLNALGFASFASGALDVLLQTGATISLLLLKDKDVPSWLFLLIAIVSTTVHSQDMYDQLGDAAAGRKTIPLVFGDSLARWSIALGCVFWSFVAAGYYWSSGPLGYLLTGSLAALVASRTLWLRSVEEDRTTFVVYNIWLTSVYALPLVARC
jgi:4-hydroxybenzoate polyprenyltransferase